MQPSQEVPASSGMCAVSRSSGESTPRPTSTPQTADVTDFDTDINRCGVDGVMPLAYRSVTTLPAMQHEQPVGVRLVEEPLEADAAPAELQLEPVEVTLGRGSRPAPDRRGRCAPSGSGRGRAGTPIG